MCTVIDCERLIQERKVSLKKWQEALEKMKLSGGTSGKNKANEAEVWDVQEKFERRRGIALEKEITCNDIERLLGEINYGIEGMMYRLGLRIKQTHEGDLKHSHSGLGQYSPNKSADDIKREKDDKALKAVIDSFDETKAAAAKLLLLEHKRKATYKEAVKMIKEWFELVKERKTMVNYYMHTKNTRLLEKRAPFIRKLSYTKKGRQVLKLREQVLNTIRRYGKPVAASSNSAISMLHRTLGKRQEKQEKKSPTLKGLLKQKRMSNAFSPTKKRFSPKKRMTKGEKQQLVKKMDPNNDLLEAFIEKKVEDIYHSPENRRVRAIGEGEGGNPFVIKASDLNKQKDDEEGHEYRMDQKISIKRDTKSHLHLTLWEAEASGDHDIMRKAENAIAEHNFIKKRKPRQKKKTHVTSLHKPKRTTIVGDNMVVERKKRKKTKNMLL